MAIKIDYRIVDDVGDYADISVFANVNDDDSSIVITQDGSEVSIPFHMVHDLIQAMQRLTEK